MADKKLSIVIAAVDQFTGTFQKAINTVLKLNKPIDDTRKNLKKLESEAAIKSITKQMDELGTVAKGAVSAVGELVPAVSTLAALGSLAGTAVLVKNAVDTRAAMSRAAQSIGTTTSVLQTWGGALFEVTGNAEESTAAMDALARTLEDIDALRGDPQAIAIFKKGGLLGLRTKEGLVDFDRMMKGFGRIFETTMKGEGGIQAARNIARISGLDAFSPLFMQGTAGVNQRLAKFRQFHGIISQEDIDRAQQLSEKFNLMQLAAEGAGAKIMNVLVPALDKVADKILKVISTGQDKGVVGAATAGGSGIIAAGQRGLRGTGLVMGTDRSNPELMFDLTPLIDATKWLWSGMVGSSGEAPAKPPPGRAPVARVPSARRGAGLDDDQTGTQTRNRGVPAGQVDINVRFSGAPNGMGVLTQQSGDVNTTVTSMPSHGVP